jgi:hypothetical protein
MKKLKGTARGHLHFAPALVEFSWIGTGACLHVKVRGQIFSLPLQQIQQIQRGLLLESFLAR